ncbi:MAG TPA: PLD nuclease N-terminal domain-containing protein [Verrucomicrobiae bacterium]|jgi:uncharacterized membrane protein
MIPQTLLATLFAEATDIVFLLFLLGLVFWVWMLIDCASNEKEGSTKIAWLLIILFVVVIGAPLYFFLRKMPRQR